MKKTLHEGFRPSGRPIMGRPISDILCTAAAALAIALGSANALAQQPPAWGPSLFAPSLEAGRAIDAGRKLTVTPFYIKPASEPPARPGTLVRAEPATDFALPPGVTATRILYHTRTADDTDTLATGVVLVPYGHPPPGGWPLLAWSHGTSGVAMSCAPSLMKSLFYDWQGLYEYVTLGYAVVATDYAGLGTTSRHAYLDILSNATDVVHSVSAAHAAVPNLSGRWIVVGHSQGGLSSLGVAELEARIKDPDFLGAVALAGASDLSDAIDSILSVKLPVLNGLVAFWIYGVETVYPKFKPKDVLTPTAYSTYLASVDDGCSAASGAFAAMPTDRMLVPGWRRNRYIKQFMERNRPGSLPTFGPLLLVGGGNDVLFTQAAGRKIVDRICAAGGQLQWKVYPALGHDEVVYGSLKDQIGWIADRFDGKAAPNDCVSR
ncbi:pimeloyl-ACP methyl ester carboxylesterase [Burkholderia sp. PvR073]|uniref:alpha/beta fold hydrolase n=1 Tax=Burkholderia ambifaria TaxID=152480 RepID=UPI00339A0D38